MVTELFTEKNECSSVHQTEHQTFKANQNQSNHHRFLLLKLLQSWSVGKHVWLVTTGIAAPGECLCYLKPQASRFKLDKRRSILAIMA
ncbi:MAG: hypothetical protein D6768_01025 [Chloroflexi bacterium]|nr:MAG: hypothetical protein D6768_01025 [Chloroflexota bacterium]